MFRAFLITTTALLLSGCASMYVYPDLDSVPREKTSALSGLVLGVERNHGDERQVSMREYEAPYDLQTLVDALNEHQVFRRVAYLDELDVKPDLILRNYRAAQPGFRGRHGEEGGFLCVGYNFPIVLVSLTVIPFYCSSDDEVSFTVLTPEGSRQSDLQYPRYSKLLAGVWAPVAAKLNPSWQNASTDDSEGSARAELARRYKKFVAWKFLDMEPEIARVSNGEK